MNNQGVRFVRIRGRIVPIRNKKAAVPQSDSSFKKFAAAGALHRVVSTIGAQRSTLSLSDSIAAKLGRNFKLTILTPHKAAAIASGAIGLGIFGANIYDSYQHGKRKKSFWSGVGRNFTNSWAAGLGSIGAAAGSGFIRGAAKGVAAKVGPMLSGRKFMKAKDLIGDVVEASFKKPSQKMLARF